jgi:vacuolar protein sorting-associated protein 13A/C
MLEGIVSNILTDYLDKYISNFDPELLNIAVWKGDVTLQNLLLKEYALDNIHPLAPVIIAFGQLGKLTLKIPWSKLHLKVLSFRVRIRILHQLLCVKLET